LLLPPRAALRRVAAVRAGRALPAKPLCIYPWWDHWGREAASAQTSHSADRNRAAHPANPRNSAAIGSPQSSAPVKAQIPLPPALGACVSAVPCPSSHALLLSAHPSNQTGLLAWREP